MAENFGFLGGDKEEGGERGEGVQETEEEFETRVPAEKRCFECRRHDGRIDGDLLCTYYSSPRVPWAGTARDDNTSSATERKEKTGPEGTVVWTVESVMKEGEDGRSRFRKPPSFVRCTRVPGWDRMTEISSIVIQNCVSSKYPNLVLGGSIWALWRWGSCWGEGTAPSTPMSPSVLCTLNLRSSKSTIR